MIARTGMDFECGEPGPPGLGAALLDHARPEKGMPRILIFDEHGVYRLGLALTLKSALATSSVFQTGSIETTLSMLQTEPGIDVALLDLDIADPESAGFLRDMARAAPQTRLVLLIPWNSPEAVLAAISAGLHGAVSKAQSDSEIIHAISDVLSGRIYVPVWMGGPREERAGEPQPGSEWRETTKAENRMFRLTPRQREVFLLIAEGLSNKEIAQRLEISEATAKIHIAAVFRVLQVRNRTEAALLAREWRD
ncbi:response regulator transcription factor [Enterovirga sp. DB1703]|uniref:Response regulator transcription factor n=2 Tax=Enterovirga aerilata TaxID=2730920 RepID=A0A849I9L2_9HYPH|nr:response regulator transcription factor [Enterovirga sp. DB1703]